MPDPSAAAAAPIRDAATLILVRAPADRGAPPRVLMGQRGRGAVFMPNKFVFPGGALDPEDAAAGALPAAGGLAEACRARLERPAPPPAPPLAYPAAAVRETFEETGLRLGAPASEAAASLAALGGTWAAFAADGLAPRLSGLRYVFRAITPPGPPRRFDARFFVAPAAALHGDPDDFSAAGAELSHLTWAPLPEARALELPFITSVVLAEIQALVDAGWDPGEGRPAPSRPVPFFRHSEDRSEFIAL